MAPLGGLTGSERIVGYCDHCDQELGPASSENLGRRVQCPNDNAKDHLHLARVVRIPKGRRWLSLETLLLRWQAGKAPGVVVRIASGCPPKATGSGRLMRLGLVALSGLALSLNYSPPCLPL